MRQSLQLFSTQPASLQPNCDDWTFSGASTRDLTHCYHDYPARMIPQVAGKLIETFGANAERLFDPYCGSGTSLVEASIRGIDAIGTDLNPLARLITRAKVASLPLNVLERQIAVFNKVAFNKRRKRFKETPSVYGITNIDFWFKPEVAHRLFQIRQIIREIEEPNTRLFFQVAFSETVRESSNTRNGEFKLYRYDKDKLSQFNPDVYGIMAEKLRRNLQGYGDYKAIIDTLACTPLATICDFNTTELMPGDLVPPQTIDIVVTSPPYGDSSTTVAYGQYSRLSAAWLGLEEPDKTDSKLMGGKKIKELAMFPCTEFSCAELNKAIATIKDTDEKRARQIASFYVDLLSSINNVATAIKRDGYACYVVGNRKVKGVVLPTDIAVKCFFEDCGFEHIETFTRSIPNKRMPAKNSPSNVAGMLDNTMTQEYIVIMRRVLA